MDQLFELFLGPLYDKLIVKIKRLRARRLLLSPEVQGWFQAYRADTRYMKALLSDDNLLDLFLDQDYRRKLSVDQELRNRFVSNLESRMANMEKQ